MEVIDGTDGEESFNALYSRYKKQSKDLPFALTKDEFKKLTQQNCYYCGVEPQQEQNNGTYLYNGLDRLDNNLGYIANNVVACCKTCNRAKHALDAIQFKSWLK